MPCNGGVTWLERCFRKRLGAEEQTWLVEYVEKALKKPLRCYNWKDMVDKLPEFRRSRHSPHLDNHSTLDGSDRDRELSLLWNTFVSLNQRRLHIISGCLQSSNPGLHPYIGKCRLTLPGVLCTDISWLAVKDTSPKDLSSHFQYG